MASSRPNISNPAKIIDLTPGSLMDDFILDIQMYRRVIKNYLLTARRVMNVFNKFPLHYIKTAGMSSAREIHMQMFKYKNIAFDTPWVSAYREQFNKELNLKLDPSSSLLLNYSFIRACNNQVDINSSKILADFIIYSDKRWGGKCYKCSFLEL